VKGDYGNKPNRGAAKNKANLITFSVRCSEFSVKMRKGYLKKQTQFSTKANELKTSYNKEIREIYWIGHLVKTKPIKANFKIAAAWSCCKNAFNANVIDLL